MLHCMPGLFCQGSFWLRLKDTRSNVLAISPCVSGTHTHIRAIVLLSASLPLVRTFGRLLACRFWAVVTTAGKSFSSADRFVDCSAIGVLCVGLVGEIIVAVRIASRHKDSGHYRIALRRIRGPHSAPLVRSAQSSGPTWQRSRSYDLPCELTRSFGYVSQQCSRWVTLRA